MLGALIGYLTGTYMPSYYWDTVWNGREGFNPVAVGVGQGLTRGLGIGVFVGLAIPIIAVVSQRLRGK